MGFCPDSKFFYWGGKYKSNQHKTQARLEHLFFKCIFCARVFVGIFFGGGFVANRTFQCILYGARVAGANWWRNHYFLWVFPTRFIHAGVFKARP